MAVKVGSARIDENGSAHGGKAGDQTGKEVSTQAWYKHSKGWRVLRCKDSGKAESIARAMEAACANDNIGYDQYQRQTLYDQAKKVGFDPGRVATPCETDCSALVRVCLAYAGITVGNFRTTDQARVMLATGAFEELTGAQYTDRPDYLRRGDVLVTRTQGHTVVVLSDGDKVQTPATDTTTDTARTLRKGMRGEDVKALQTQLMQLGFRLPRYDADGDFGSETLAAVKAFQRRQGLDVDGQVGPKTRAALTAQLKASTVIIVGGQCFVRTQPSTAGDILGVAARDSQWPYGGGQVNGWVSIQYKGQLAWVSGKYGQLGR